MRHSMLRALCIAGIAAAFALSRPAAAADVPACPGLTDFTLVVILRSVRTLSVGDVVWWANTVAIAVALLLFARVVLSLGVSVLAACAVVVAVATTPLLSPTLAAPPAAAFAVCAAAWLATRHRSPLAWTVAGSILAAVWAVSGCVGPGAIELSAIGASPLPAALALLGAWTIVTQPTTQWRWVFGIVATLGLTGATAAIAFAFWILCALGLQDAMRQLSGGWVQRSGGVLLVCAVAVFSLLASGWGRVVHPAVPAAWSWSRNVFLETISPLPDGAALVREDAVTALLERALPSRVRERRALGVVDAVDDEVTAQLARTRVFAFPKAGHELEQMGFRVVPHGTNPDLAEVLTGSPCSATLTPEWRAHPTVAVAGAFALVANDAESRGPVYVFIRSMDPLAVNADNWPSGAERGFHARTFGITSANTPDARLELDLPAYGAEGERSLLEGPWVARIEMWRVPGAPLVLPVTMGAVPTHIVARLAGSDATQKIRLCPVFQTPQ